jgi:aspartate ammonia-lyase
MAALNELKTALESKAAEFADVLKMGRTENQDAVPMTLGQEFGAYAVMVGSAMRNLNHAVTELHEINMGATAIGTGLNSPPGYADLVTQKLAQVSGLPVCKAADLVEATQDSGAFVQMSATMKRAAVQISKMCHDLRWLSSGPRCGFGEIGLPDTQPGSSIMPGKVNPVMCESVLQVAAHVIGCDATITICGQAGNFELNVMMPIMALKLLEAITFSASVAKAFTEKCIVGIEANKDHAEEMIEKSLAMVTALAPVIGYDAAAKIAKESFTTGKTVREVARAHKVLPDDKLDKILDPWRMTEPGIPKKD